MREGAGVAEQQVKPLTAVLGFHEHQSHTVPVNAPGKAADECLDPCHQSGRPRWSVGSCLQPEPALLMAAAHVKSMRSCSGTTHRHQITLYKGHEHPPTLHGIRGHRILCITCSYISGPLCPSLSLSFKKILCIALVSYIYREG